MKVFFIDPNNNTAQVNYPLVEKLSDLGENITYFTSYNRWDTSYYEKHYEIKSAYIFFDIANKISNQKIRQIIKGLTYPFNLLRLFFIILKNKPNIIHANNITIAFVDLLFFSLLKIFNQKIILTQHNFLEHNKESVSKLKLKALNKANKIICLSEFTKKQFPENLQAKIVTISHGNVYEKEIKKYADTNSLNKNRDYYQLLFFGLIRPYKGIENLIDAYFLLSKPLQKNIKLKIIGKAFNKNYIKDLKKKKQGISNIQIIDKFLDYKEMIQIIQESDIGILPYNSATQSGVPYLYSSLFKPLIVTNVGALKEQVDIKFAEIAEPNEKSINKSIEKMIQRMDRNEIKSENFITFNKQNSWSSIVQKYRDLYISIK